MHSVQELRARIQGLSSPVAREFFPFSKFSDGFPRGALVEITGRGKCGVVADFLAENLEFTVWIEKKREIFPSALLQRKVDLQKILFVEGKNEAAWVAATALRSKVFPIVVFDCVYKDERDLRRWQLLAEKAKATMILLREKPSKFWPISLSLQVNGRAIEVLRQK